MVHVGALPGTPRSRRSVAVLAAHAATDAVVLQKAGFDAVLIENMHDAPYVVGPHGPEVTAAMTAAALAVREAVGDDLAMGVQVLARGEREALAVAQASSAQFIRCENFVFSHVADEGLMVEASAGPLLRYRRAIGAESVAVLCDLKKKHAAHAITADVGIADAAKAAEFFDADGVIVTGVATGTPVEAADLAAVRGATKLPVLVGSGVTPEGMADLAKTASGLIIGSWIKRGGVWTGPIDAAKCRALVKARDRAA
jgi:hypothetical protein